MVDLYTWTTPNGFKISSAPMALFEPGAILLYLAQKTKKRMPADERVGWDASQ